MDLFSALRPLITAVGFALLLTACVGPARGPEKDARERVDAVGKALRPARSQPVLPPLTDRSELKDYVVFGLLHHPSVAAAYYDWRAAVESITPAGALPDPKLTFEADITDTIMTLMPGLMFDIMAPGKRAAMAREAAAGSEVAYRAYVSELYRIAAGIRNGWIEIAFVDQALQLRGQAMGAIEQSSALEASAYMTATGMASLEVQVGFLNQTAQLRTTIASLEDRRTAARLKFKASLGLAPDERDPTWPRAKLEASTLSNEADLWRAIKAANPSIASMRSMVEMTVAAVQVAQKSGTPDFSLGAMVDLKASPLMVRPTASINLPIWRSKIAATIAEAEARRNAAIARLDAEQLTMAAEFAQMLYMIRESDRMIDYIDHIALPNLDRSIASAEAAYQSGMVGPAMIPQTRLMALGMGLERAEALRVRETSVTGLLLMTADVLPPDSPLLSLGPRR